MKNDGTGVSSGKCWCHSSVVECHAKHWKGDGLYPQHQKKRGGVSEEKIKFSITGEGASF